MRDRFSYQNNIYFLYILIYSKLIQVHIKSVFKFVQNSSLVPYMCRGELSAVIARLMSKCLEYKKKKKKS